ncbi:MAG TPA: OB-fold nucleic acid binding domain-containing protein, partial [Burkholderiaceae bacterium]|nr:OB-fold nucleic acid binding domain-containing protein [Burkholderiaceae bacterium]
VCYCLGITEVDPARATLLFERFISRERDEPPDIDVDFEHQRREEVIQYIYAKYGRDRAALAATVISYRPRSALRDVGWALGVDERLIHAFCKEHPGMYGRKLYPERLAQILGEVREGTEPAPGRPKQASAPLGGAATAGSVGGDAVGHEHLVALWLSLAEQLLGFPRHLSQHVGGFVLTEGPLTRLVPIEPAAMDGRSIIQWDKDDLDAVGLMKVDVLALGMLTALRRALHLLTAKGLPARTLAAIPPECPAVYAMVSRADTVGVFQIESRAQMSMLPRLRPEMFYDLVVQVAIVRPGPIQGGMVHPYLRRRRGLEPVVHLSPQLEQSLGRTLGVPIFQEQVMQVVMLCAGFSAGEADELRRAMAAWKRKGGVDRFRSRVVQGMVAQGYPQDFAEAIFAQIEGFGEYGFPESHAASFALLAYASAWLKCHHPDVFLAALLNSQPMGFYSPSQLVQDAQRHGVQVLPVDVRFSDWDCTLAQPDDAARLLAEPPPPPPRSQPRSPALRPVRLGLRLVKNFKENAALRLCKKREQLWNQEHLTWASVEELARLAGLNQAELDALAAADALRGLAGHRRTQVWAAAGAVPLAGLFRPVGADDDALPPSLLPEPTPAQDVVVDHAATGLSLRAHPVSFLRPQLAALRLSTAAELAAYPSGRLARACGIVTVRQQPGTASGVVFVTLEDETGTVNVIVWPALKERQRHELTRSRLMAVYGVWQRDDETGGQVRHLVAKRLRDLTPLLGSLQTQSRDFH